MTPQNRLSVSSNKLKVLPTNTPHRKFAKGDYVISLHKKTKKELDIGHFAVVGYHISYFGCDECREGMQKKNISCEKFLTVHARVITSDETSIDALKIKPDEIRIDQSIRNAIGIPYSYENAIVEIFPIKMPWLKYAYYISRYYFTWIFGYRYLYYRVCSAHVHDMENGICRIPADTFPILGTDIQNKLVFESVVLASKDNESPYYEIETRNIASHELTHEIMELRLTLEKKPEIRYRNPEQWFDVKPDISRVFMDLADRERLGLDQLYPVKARRDIYDLFKSQILRVGIFFFISSLSIGGLLPLSKSWSSFIISLLLGLPITLFLMWIHMRARIK